MGAKWSHPTEEEILAQIAAAEERGRLAERYEVTALRARYEPESGWTVVELSNGCRLSFPPDLPEVRGLSPEERARVWVHPTGDALFWEGTDASVYLPLLLTGRVPELAGLESSRPAEDGEREEPPLRHRRTA